MGKAKGSYDKFDDYLHRIQARERSQRWRRLSLAVLLLGLIIVGSLVVMRTGYFEDQLVLQSFQFDELDAEEVNTLFTEDPRPILVQTDIGWDTVTSLEEFNQLSELVALLRQGQGDEWELDEWEGDSLQMSTAATISQFVVDVEGDRSANQNLVFSVENYDPEVKYVLDFGNGVRRRLNGQKTRYAYPLPGRFTMQLVASHPSKGSSVYTKKYEISGEDQPLAVRAKVNASREPSGSEPSVDLPQFSELNEMAVPRALNNEPEEAERIDLAQVEVEDISTRENLRDLDAVENPGIPVRERSTIFIPDQPLVYAEEMPAFPGGKTALNKYLSRKLSYPLPAIDQGIEGQVIVQFVVGGDGALSDLKVIKGIGGGCDEEALRVIRGMRSWIPGKMNGQAVPVYTQVPITFKLYD